MTAETIIQSLASGLLMGLLYGLIAVGLALIFGLMDVVNFAHGEFLMIAMYATFFLFAFFAIDPLLAAPLVAAALFVFGAVVYLVDRALCGAGQGQCRHGADLLHLRARDRDARPGAVLLHAGLPQRHAFLARRQDRLDRRHLPAAAAAGRRAGLDRGLRRALLLHQPHRFRPRAGGHARGCRRGGAGRHRQEPRVRAGLGPRRGAGRPRRRRSWRCSSTSIPTSARRSR